jgi:hypothetical protein
MTSNPTKRWLSFRITNDSARSSEFATVAGQEDGRFTSEGGHSVAAQYRSSVCIVDDTDSGSSASSTKEPGYHFKRGTITLPRVLRDRTIVVALRLFLDLCP